MRQKNLLRESETDSEREKEKEERRKEKITRVDIHNTKPFMPVYQAFN